MLRAHKGTKPETPSRWGTAELGVRPGNGVAGLPPPMRAWLTQPHGRRHKAPPPPCALTTTTTNKTVVLPTTTTPHKKVCSKANEQPLQPHEITSAQSGESVWKMQSTKMDAIQELKPEPIVLYGGLAGTLDISTVKDCDSCACERGHDIVSIIIFRTRNCSSN